MSGRRSTGRSPGFGDGPRRQQLADHEPAPPGPGPQVHVDQAPPLPRRGLHPPHQLAWADPPRRSPSDHRYSGTV